MFGVNVRDLVDKHTRYGEVVGTGGQRKLFYLFTLRGLLRKVKAGGSALSLDPK